MPPATVKTVTSIKNMTELLAQLKLLPKTKGPVWFRGHADADWKLHSGFNRLQDKLKDKAPSESTLIKRFKQSAAMLLDHRPKDSFDWLFLMQHYGIPTRLLDWSESPLVALYFAVSELENKDGALWALFPTELNKEAKIDPIENFYIPGFEDTELQNYTVENLKGENISKLTPIATIATRNNPRIQAQLGVFTVSHRDMTPIESLGKKKHAIKIKIPKIYKKKILEELRLCGITRFQLFPELSSISDNLKEVL